MKWRLSIPGTPCVHPYKYTSLSKLSSIQQHTVKTQHKIFRTKHNGKQEKQKWLYSVTMHLMNRFGGSQLFLSVQEHTLAWSGYHRKHNTASSHTVWERVYSVNNN